MKTALNLKNRISDKISEILQSGFSMYRYLRKRCYGMDCITTYLLNQQALFMIWNKHYICYIHALPIIHPYHSAVFLKISNG